MDKYGLISWLDKRHLRTTMQISNTLTCIALFFIPSGNLEICIPTLAGQSSFSFILSCQISDPKAKEHLTSSIQGHKPCAGITDVRNNTNTHKSNPEMYANMTTFQPELRSFDPNEYPNCF